MLRRLLSVTVLVAAFLLGCSDDGVGDVTAYCERSRSLGEIDPFASERIDVRDVGAVQNELRAAVERAESLAEVAPDQLEDEHDRMVESAREAFRAAEELDFDLQSTPGRSDVVIGAFDDPEAQEAAGEIATFVAEHCPDPTTTSIEASPAEVDAIASLSDKELAIALEVTGLPNARALADAFREGEVEVEDIEAEIRARSAAAPQGQGDDQELDDLWIACEDGSLGSCDELYERAGINTAYEEFGGTCGGRVARRVDGGCAALAEQIGPPPSIESSD